MRTTLMSMTGFGASAFSVGGVAWRVEIRSVNHKALAARFHWPAELALHEAAVTRRLRDRLVRGAVDVSVTADGSAGEGFSVNVDHGALKALMAELTTLAGELGATPPSLDAALRLGPFVTVERRRFDPATLEAPLLTAVDAALDGLVAMREAEGASLAADLRARLLRIADGVEVIATTSPEVLVQMRERLAAKLREAAVAADVAIDPGRALAEVIVMADKSDVTEEVVRARTHLGTLAALLTDSDGADAERGRRLDFMTQELLRELNTMGSKGRDATIAARVVDAKVELEKIREQVQNIA
jgi:uncharacterized protein (TIGR00255 family)